MDSAARGLKLKWNGMKQKKPSKMSSFALSFHGGDSIRKNKKKMAEWNCWSKAIILWLLFCHHFRILLLLPLFYLCLLVLISHSETIIIRSEAYDLHKDGFHLNMNLFLPLIRCQIRSVNGMKEKDTKKGEEINRIRCRSRGKICPLAPMSCSGKCPFLLFHISHCCYDDDFIWFECVLNCYAAFVLFFSFFSSRFLFFYECVSSDNHMLFLFSVLFCKTKEYSGSGMV